MVNAFARLTAAVIDGFSSGKLLLDYQPLKKQQWRYDVEVPWKECEVLVQSGRFSGCQGIIKNVQQDF